MQLKLFIIFLAAIISNVIYSCTKSLEAGDNIPFENVWSANNVKLLEEKIVAMEERLILLTKLFSSLKAEVDIGKITITKTTKGNV